jgi:hypothetical protein
MPWRLQSVECHQGDQDAGDGGRPDTGNTCDELGVIPESRVAVNMLVDLRFQLYDLAVSHSYTSPTGVKEGFG